ncbi:hypothetical protein AB0L57_03220 [Nocardia sp. NPDC052254]|uniref:hypothetical protein n=1 Tax=Nocardia sp. NPDC052254 TaxID=3155681 RepID=UPI0034149667
MTSVVRYLRMRTLLEAVPFVVVCVPLIALAKQQIPRLYGLTEGVGISPARLVPIVMACGLVAATGSRLGEIHEDTLASRLMVRQRASLVGSAVSVALVVVVAMGVPGVPRGGIVRAGFDTAQFFGVGLVACAFLPRAVALAACLLISWSIQTLPWWYTPASGTWTDMRGFTISPIQLAASVSIFAVGGTAWILRPPRVRSAAWARWA